MIVDDHTLFRTGLQMLLEKHDGINVVSEAANAADALDKLKEHCVDIVLMDISLPGMDGLDATSRIKKEYPSVKVIILTMHNDEPYLLKALEAGAAGYILKEAASTELVSAVQAANKGKIIIHPSLVKVLVNKAIGKKPGRKKRHSRSDSVLTKREIEVLNFICLGYTNQEIGDRLIISVKTVEKHRENMLEKLGLKKRYQLVEYALKNRLISLEP